MRWIDEEATIQAILQLGNRRVVTKFMAETNFIASAIDGDLIEMGLVSMKLGNTSITMRAEVRNMVTKKNILTVNSIVFVSLASEAYRYPIATIQSEPSEAAYPRSINSSVVINAPALFGWGFRFFLLDP